MGVQATEILQNVGLKNVWPNSKNHFRHLCQITLKMLHPVYSFKKCCPEKNNEKCLKIENFEILILYFFNKFILFVFI